jgi:hypothetical protein
MNYRGSKPMLKYNFQSKYHRRFDGAQGIRRPRRADHAPSHRLPHYIDLREWMTPIVNQGTLNIWWVLFQFHIFYFLVFSHCSSAAAFGSACEYLIKRQTGYYVPISQLFIYFNGRFMDQETYSVVDDGASRRNVVKSMHKFGICPEELWPFKKHLLNKKPPDYVYDEAKRYTVVSHQIPLDITAIKTCLANQIPAIVGIKIQNGSNNEARVNGGYLLIPDPENIEIAYTGTHAVLLVGYDDKREHFIVRNSWGSQWVRTNSFIQSSVH